MEEIFSYVTKFQKHEFFLLCFEKKRRRLDWKRHDNLYSSDFIGSFELLQTNF